MFWAIFVVSLAAYMVISGAVYQRLILNNADKDTSILIAVAWPLAPPIWLLSMPFKAGTRIATPGKRIPRAVASIRKDTNG